LKKSVFHYFDKWEEYLLAIFMTFMLITLTAQVFCRYVLSFSFSWAEQASRIGFVWLTMVGISLAAKKGMHLKIDALPQFFPKTAKCVIFISNTITIFFGFGMGYLILKTVVMQFELKQYFSSIPWLPTWTMYIAGVIGLFGLSVRTAQNIYSSFTEKRDHHHSEKIRNNESVVAEDSKYENKEVHC
jgi:TRAP-type C4-dicarboxylate transport system permease small subunit